jgi:dihydrofolate synthase/folylpolyglutamate synthase
MLAILRVFMHTPLDLVILEVGLGGRLDAVNIVDTDCAVLTSIDLDHTDWLGPTREDIGREKAGIFRAGQQAICGDPDPPRSLLAHAEVIGAPLWRFGLDFTCTALGMQWNYAYPALRGAYQLVNAATALAAVDALRVRLPVPASAIRQALVNVELPGRFQVLPGRPTVVLDVAHNPQAARAFADTLGTMGYHPRTLAVFGMLADKDIEGVAASLVARVDRWYVAALPGARGASAARIARALSTAGVAANAVRIYDSIEHAFVTARNDANETDRIAAFGSFLTVAAALHAARAAQ